MFFLPAFHFRWSLPKMKGGGGRGLPPELGLHNAVVALPWWDIHALAGSRLLSFHL